MLSLKAKLDVKLDVKLGLKNKLKLQIGFKIALMMRLEEFSKQKDGKKKGQVRYYSKECKISLRWQLQRLK